MADAFPVTGNLASRWQAYGAADGPFGRPTGPEHPIPGRSGVRQTFEFGEIAFSPDQEMVISVFRLRNEVCFEWSPTRFEYDFYRYDIAFNGVPQGQAAMKHSGVLRVWVRLQGFGEYAFIVKGCTSPVIGADECRQGFTPPVRVQFAPFAETPDPGGPAVTGAIADRWHELGGWDGPLGKVLTPEIDFAVEGFRGQRFEQGWIATAPAFGPNFVFAVYARGPDLEVNWGGANVPFNAFRVTLFGAGEPRQEMVWDIFGIRSARPTNGGGQVAFSGLPNGFYEITIEPTITLSPGPGPFEPFTFGSTAKRGTFLIHRAWDTRLGELPVQGYTAGEVYASQASRASEIAQTYARRLPLRVAFPGSNPDKPEATEDDMFQLIAHLHAISEEPDFRAPGELPSRVLAHVRIRQYRRGKVGTNRDYDLCLKGLMVVIHRYRPFFTDVQFGLILRDLIPDNMTGGHDPAVEIALAVLGVDIPETENHLLMIETTRYFMNQFEFQRTGDRRFNNNANGLTGWLLDFLSNIARFDFLEFNARPYTRLSSYVLLNLYEFAKDDALRRAAQHILDYLTVKFAVSSNRYRRIPPFRRLMETTNHPETEWNDLLAPRGDLLTGFFLIYCGHITPDFRLHDHFPGGWHQVCIIPGTSSYRPPPAAYRLAMERRGPMQHRVVHGRRRRHPISPDEADGGVEIYYSSRSFLLSAGGMFLNSGYGRDEIDIGVNAFAQTARAQAITLIPTGVDLPFVDLIRFDQFPDWMGKPDPEEPFKGSAVTTGVHRGFACGANLRVPQRWLDVAATAIDGPWIFLNLNRDVDGARLGFYVAAYHTPVRDVFEVADFNFAIPFELNPRLDNLACLYAMESDSMPFETFTRVTRERNPHLPDKFGYGERNAFHTADGHSFTFMLSPSGVVDKYRARVFEMDGVAIPDHNGSLPLVDGPHLRSPERGLIEIIAPDCATPLVLDYRNRLDPRRSDDVAACPGPWRERDAQVIGFAGRWLTRSREQMAASRPVEAVAAARHALATMRHHTPLPGNAAQHWATLEACVQALAVLLIDVGRRDEALRRVTETIDVAKQAVAQPGGDAHAIAGQLLNLSTKVNAFISPAAAAAPAQAAADITRGPAAAPGASAELTVRFAVSLQTLADRLFESQQDAAGVVAARESIAAYQHAAAAPGANLDSIGGQLMSLSNRLNSHGMLADAIVSLTAAADVLRPIATSDGADAPMRALFTVVLLTLAMRLLDARRPADAGLAAREMVAASNHAAAAPDANHVSLAGNLFTLSNQLFTAGLLAEAIEPIDAATEILRDTASEADAPVATRSLFAALLLTLGRRLAAVGRNDEALDAAEESVAVYRALLADDPATFGPLLAGAEGFVATLG